VSKGDYLLRFWGRDADSYAERLRMIGVSPVEERTGGALVAWFRTDAERAAAVATVRRPESQGGCVMVVADHDGPLVHCYTVAVAALEVNGRQYEVRQDFGLGFPSDAAHYIWEEGNFSCDCNRSALIAEQCDPEIEELECGNTIKLVMLTVKHEDGP